MSQIARLIASLAITKRTSLVLIPGKSLTIWSGEGADPLAPPSSSSAENKHRVSQQSSMIDLAFSFIKSKPCCKLQHPPNETEG